MYSSEGTDIGQLRASPFQREHSAISLLYT
jgi:hypothetical protein